MPESTSNPPLELLRRTVNDLKAKFGCGGTVKLESLGQEQLLWYRSTEQTEEARIVGLPFTANDTARLHEAAVPSPHGRNGETVFDPTYRQAREITSDSPISIPPQTNNFAINFDPLSPEHNILSSIARLSIGTGLVASGPSSLFARLYKLNSYATGGFFKSHRDTPKADNHVGSIVICLPSSFTGGELLVRHDGDEIKFDWKDTSEKKEVAWAFFYSDCEHEIGEVLGGTRITLSYDVFKHESAPPIEQAIDLRGTTLYKAMERVVESQRGATEPLKLGIAFKHAYPIDRVRLSGGRGTNQSNSSTGRGHLSKLPSILKGYDSEIYHTAKALGLNTHFVVIHDPPCQQYWESDGEGDWIKKRRGGLPLTSTSFEYVTEAYQMEEGETAFLMDVQGASYDDSVDWLRTGDSAQYVMGTYLMAGNTADLDHFYVSTGLVITISNK